MENRKRILKYVVVLLYVVFSGVLFITPVKADERSIILEEKVKFLESIGTPKNVIETYNSTQIERTYKNLFGKNAHFAGAESKIIEVKDETSSLRGNISTSKLKLSVGVYDMVDEATGEVFEINVSVGYEWLSEPIWQSNDALTFSWDKDLFYDEGFYHESLCSINGWIHTIEYITTPALASEGGFGWYSKLGIHLDDASIYKHFGGGDIRLIPKRSYKESTDLNSKMYFQYAHQIAGVGISFGITGDLGVSINGGNYDEQALSYTYH